MSSVIPVRLLAILVFRWPSGSLKVLGPRRLAIDVASRLTVLVVGRLGSGEPTPIAPVLDSVFGVFCVFGVFGVFGSGDLGHPRGLRPDWADHERLEMGDVPAWLARLVDRPLLFASSCVEEIGVLRLARFLVPNVQPVARPGALGASVSDSATARLDVPGWGRLGRLRVDHAPLRAPTLCR